MAIVSEISGFSLDTREVINYKNSHVSCHNESCLECAKASRIFKKVEDIIMLHPEINLNNLHFSIVQFEDDDVNSDIIDDEEYDEDEEDIITFFYIIQNYNEYRESICMYFSRWVISYDEDHIDKIIHQYHL